MTVLVLFVPPLPGTFWLHPALCVSQDGSRAATYRRSWPSLLLLGAAVCCYERCWSSVSGLFCLMCESSWPHILFFSKAGFRLGSRSCREKTHKAYMAAVCLCHEDEPCCGGMHWWWYVLLEGGMQMGGEISGVVWHADSCCPG